MNLFTPIYPIKINEFQKKNNDNIIKQKKKMKNNTKMVTQTSVQFFDSGSSLLSQSILSQSHLDNYHRQIVQDTQTILKVLKNTLKPRKDLVNINEVSDIVHRAKILYKDTIPQYLLKLSRNNNNNHNCQAENQCQKCIKQLQNLVKNFQKYSYSTLSYQQFYKLYGNYYSYNEKKTLHDVNNLQIKPDVVNIIQLSNEKKNNTYYNMTKFEKKKSEYQLDQQKKIQGLNQQIIQGKKKQKLLNIRHQQQKRKMRQDEQQRINNILKIFQIQNKQKIDQIIQRQFKKNTDQLNIEVKKNRELERQKQNLRKDKQEIQKQKIILENQLQQNKIINSRQFYQLQNQQIGQNMDRTKDKIIRNLKYQINLLTTQLNKQRQQYSKNTKQKSYIQQNKIIELQKLIQQNNNEINNLKFKLDQQKAKQFKLSCQLQKLKKSHELNKLLQSNKKQNSLPQSHLLLSSRCDIYHPPEENQGPKYQTMSYTGDGNQYSPYFDLMNKEFILRFKRACLRQKQLLSKSNGLQIGVISELISPNELRYHLHLSNFGDKQQIRNVKIKSFNSKNNIIQIMKNQIQYIHVGQQIKLFIHVIIKYYPIGYTALICQYKYYGKNEDIRVLLPVNIFKMLTIKPRDDRYHQSKKHQIPIQRKILRIFETLCQYFKGANIQNNNTICSSIIHQHTQTKLLCDIVFGNGVVTIEYQHRSGEETITQYIVQSLSFLFRKQ